MSISKFTPELSGTKIHTTQWREWWGWFGAMAWFLWIINSYENLPHGYSDDTVFWYAFAFRIVFVLSLIIISFCFRREPNRLGKLAFYTTPVAIVITAAFPFLPHPLASVLFALSPVFIAPAVARRAYGIIRTSTPERTLVMYMSGFAVAFGCMNAFIDSFIESEILGLPYFIAAVFALLAWLGVRALTELSNDLQDRIKRGFPKVMLFGLVGVVFVAYVLRSMNDLISFAVEQYDDILYYPVYVVFPVICWILFGLFGDRGHEKKSITSGTVLFLIAIQLAFLTSHAPTQSLAAVPLVIMNRYVWAYLIYFLLTISIYLFKYSRRPVFVASLGFAVYLISWAFSKVIGYILPETITNAGVPLYVLTALTALVFFLLLYFFFQRYKDKTLAAALYALTHSGHGDDVLQPDETPSEHSAAIMREAGFTPEEEQIAMLIMDGATPHEAARKLHLPSGEVQTHIKAIRDKMFRKDDLDPVIAVIVHQYNLTRRETDMLKCLSRHMSNSEIAAEMFLSEDTVKGHVKNLMKKIPVKSRQNITAWVKDFEVNNKK